jgi:hypothetical protein
MERNGRPRRRPEAPSAPTTLTEITRRYYATAIALSKAMGVPLSETFIREHRESISCCFIEAGRAGVRLLPAVQLPPLSGPPAADQPTEDAAIIDGITSDPERETPPTNGHTPPVAIPTDASLPCGGALIADLTPPQLHMLVSKVGFRMLAEPAYAPLFAALQAERARRLERGRRKVPRPDLDPVVHVEVAEGEADVP